MENFPLEDSPSVLDSECSQRRILGLSDRHILLSNTLTNAVLWYLSNYAVHIRAVWMPAYCCPSFSRRLQNAGFWLRFYNLDDSLRIPRSFIKEVCSDELVVVVNIFGVLDNVVRDVVRLLKEREIKVLVDNAHSLGFVSDGDVDFYSPRKFMGISDGAIISSRHKLDLNAYDSQVHRDEATHLLLRSQGRINEGYKAFLDNEKFLEDVPVMHMSESSQRTLLAFPHIWALTMRRRNFSFLHQHLGEYNKIDFGICSSEISCPLYYPLLINNGERIREMLIKNRIYTPCFWSGMESLPLSSFEANLKRSCLLLPIDHRYNERQMFEIVRCITESIGRTQ